MLPALRPNTVVGRAHRLTSFGEAWWEIARSTGATSRWPSLRWVPTAGNVAADAIPRDEGKTVRLTAQGSNGCCIVLELDLMVSTEGARIALVAASPGLPTRSSRYMEKGHIEADNAPLESVFDRPRHSVHKFTREGQRLKGIIPKQAPS